MIKHKMPSYKLLEKVFKKLDALEQIQSVLHWDSSVMMPRGGAEARAEQLGTLKSLYHAIITDPGVEELLHKAEDEQRHLSGWQKANLREMQRLYRHSNAVPRKLLKELAKMGSRCEMVWREARQNNDFKLLAGPLAQVVNLVKEIAAAKSQVLGCSPYDALLDQYDPGRKSEQLDVVFADLKNFLPDFTKQVVEKQAKETKGAEIKGPFSVEKQKALTQVLATMFGFDANKSRIDESLHPFCGGYPSDIRICTRYDEQQFVSSMMAVMHELGHAMYEEGLPENWRGQPVGMARGMSIHESQSLLIEMQACRSKEFLGYAATQFKDVLGIKGKSFTGDNLYQLCTRVQPSLIRVEADEVTYSSHIILRYYIEKYLVSGDMTVDELPEAWRQGMEKFVGIAPTDDTSGCMQDIHWMDGTFGYFPTYTLGAIYAAQLFASAKTANADIPACLGRGDFSPVKTWLREQIHDKGSRFSNEELIEVATGKPLSVDAYKEYLTSKYLAG